MTMVSGRPTEAARARAAQRWTALANRLRTVTPEAVGRAVLTVTVILVSGWLVAASWPALLPFVVGIVLAYAVLPLANRLARVMPRVFAALIAEAVALGVLLGVIVLVVPPLLRGLTLIALRLPTPDRVQAVLADLQAQLGDVPEPLRSILLSVVTQVTADLQAAINGFVDGIAAFITAQILGIFGTISFVLGLLVIPAWVLTIVADERAIKRRAASLVAPAIRTDVLALARIIDRGFGTFLRVRVLLAIVVGLLIWIGLSVADQLAIAQFQFAVTAATLLGALQLIPELGFYLGFFPMLIVFAGNGPLPAAILAIVYILANRLASAVVETRVSRGVLDVHPGLLVPAIVVLSQFGVLWLLVAAPVVAVARDLVRYLAGRLAEPPAPAGVLPGERPTERASSAGRAAAVPSVYRTPIPPSFAGRRAARAATPTAAAGGSAGGGSPVP